MIERGAHVLALRVYWEDTDAAGMVYYANYLKYAERARSDLLRVAGIDQRALLADPDGGVVFAVRHCDIDYLKPAVLDDDLEVHTTLAEIAGASIRVAQVVRRGALDLVRARIRLACLNRAGRPRRIPPAVRHGLCILPFKTEDFSDGQ